MKRRSFKFRNLSRMRGEVSQKKIFNEAEFGFQGI
jgi:hypothetical protein